MSRLPAILVVDDERNTREGLRDAFCDKYEITLADSADQALELLKTRQVDIILTDLRMPGMDGMTFTQTVTAQPNAPLIIMLTAYGSIQTAMAAMHAGAYDYLTKPVKLDDLEMMIDRGLAVLKERRGNEDERLSGAAGIIGSSEEMRNCLEKARLVAAARSTVLITGESGTGKELFARAIHDWSPRAKKPFIAVHCAALNENLLESELFGHEKGAFTGANERFIGRFERADHGTLFLDEIGEISLSTQVKLLRVLETRSLERVGGASPINIDVRLVAATNRDLKAMAAAGTFREDLYYRLNVINLQLPPLREHRDDVPLLLNHYIKLAAQDNGVNVTGFSADALKILNSYEWPGNIRELRNCVERMVVMARGKILTLSDIPREIMDAVSAQFSAGNAPVENIPQATALFTGKPASAPPAQELPLDIRSNERTAILQALEKCQGNRTKAAEILGISRRTLQRKIKQDPTLDARFPDAGA